MLGEFIKYKGRAIWYADYSRCRTKEDVVELLENTRHVFLSSEEVLVLINVNDFFASKEYLQLAKELNKELGHKVARRAILGISGVKKVLLMGFNRLTSRKAVAVPFNSKEEALDYLVSHEQKTTEKSVKSASIFN